MGLAASQARFLGITLRKANCEFKSTELAQQRLELTNQMTDISQEYASALNSTKLVWHNEMVCDSYGNSTDFGLSYSLLMMPSAANDYNPYMVSTRSGAIVLDSRYAQAAKDAGISMAGGRPSQEGRDKFLESLSLDTNGQHDNVITQKTYEILTNQATDSKGRKIASGDVAWHLSAGMGAIPKEKGAADTTTLDDLKMDNDIGGRSLDWLQIVRGIKGYNLDEAITENQYNELIKSYKEDVALAKLDYINAPESGVAKTSEEVNVLINTATAQATNLINKWSNIMAGGQTAQQKVAIMKEYAADGSNATGIGTNIITSNDDEEAFKIIGKFAYLEAQISLCQNQAQKIQYMNELERVKTGYNENGVLEKNYYEYMNPLYWTVYEQAKAENLKTNHSVLWDQAQANDSSKSGLDKILQTDQNKVADNKCKITTKDGNVVELQELTVAVNDTICYNISDLRSMQISDLLSENIVIIAKGEKDNKTDSSGVTTLSAKNSVAKSAEYLLEYIASIFGYGHIGTGLNVDTETDTALNMAMAMVKKHFLNPNNAVSGKRSTDKSNLRTQLMANLTGTSSGKSLLDNSAYINANKFNRIGTTEDEDYVAVNISNMLSAFLTYFDNYLRGSDSEYVVGKGNIDDKTNFVTNDPSYVYVTNSKGDITNDERIADFFNELYNNICEHGWRHDDMVKDSEYLESAVKDGRYQLMAINDDGYFYQMRYNDVGYMQEVQDTDAIARAESDYKVKKAQITFKEDQIDVKTKKLDAEITELTTEINSVQNIISKNIEKTFTMFSN